jgi:hypothetical protein
MSAVPAAAAAAVPAAAAGAGAPSGATEDELLAVAAAAAAVGDCLDLFADSTVDRDESEPSARATPAANASVTRTSVVIRETDFMAAQSYRA